MPSVLLIRVSSLGDVVQTFPAVTDFCRVVPDTALHWIVEEQYEPLVRLHPGVSDSIPYALRRWRKHVFKDRSWQEVSILYRRLRNQPYDTIVEAQGLLKSLAVAKIARGPIHGFGPKTVREPFVSRFYDHIYEFPMDRHRIWHYRGLMASAFGYEIDDRIESIDYGLRVPPRPGVGADEKYCVLLHGTARGEKLWPEERWIALGRRLHEEGLICLLPWGDASEQARAARLAAVIPGARLLPRLSLEEAAGLLAHARCVIGVDTGLMHLAVAYKVPVVGIYLGTRPGHHGPLGAGPTAFCGGMGMNPEVDEVFAQTRHLLDA